MKALLSVVILFFCSIFYVNAQVTKGTLLVDGNIGLNVDGDNELFEDLTFQFTPLFAYFVSDHFMLGGGVNYRVNYSNNRISTLFRFNPLVRYYFNPKSTSVNYFAEVQADFGLSSLKKTSGPYNYNFSLGLNKFLTPNIALEGRLVYFLEEQSSLFDRYRNIFILNLGLRAFLSKDDRIDWNSIDSGIAKGVMMIGISEASIILNEDDRIDINLTPNIGYFITENIALGGTLGLNYGLRLDIDDFWVAEMTIRPFARYYFNPRSKLAWFAEGAVGYTLFEFDIFGLEVIRNTFDYRIQGGANLFLTSNLALEFALGWDSANSNSEAVDTEGRFPDTPSERTSTQSNLGFNIGIQYFWNRGSNK
jgi:outer membrane protein